MVEATLAPIWDETMTFDFQIESQYQLDTEVLRVEVWDSDRIADELIGQFELDLGRVWRATDHEIYRQWVALCPEPGGEFEGIQGYLRLSVTVLPEGMELKTLHDQIDDDDLVDVLMPPSIEMVGATLHLNCFCADGLPEMDDLARSGRGCDPYISVDVAGCKNVRTKEQPSTITPNWNETLCIPILMPKIGPPTSDRVRIGVWDQDGLVKGGLLDDDRIGSTTIHLDEVDAHWSDPCWVCLYGAPKNVNAGAAEHRENRGVLGSLRDWLQGEQVSIARAMDAGVIEGSAYRGRILISGSLQTNVPEPQLICNGKLALPPDAGGPPPTVEYGLRAFVMEGNSLPQVSGGLFGSSGTSVEVSIGDHSDRTELADSVGGSSKWYQEVTLTGLEYPNDVTQLPDIFVNLVSGKDGKDRLSYYRIPVMSPDGKFNSRDLHSLGNMYDPLTDLPRARWFSLKRDIFGKLSSGYYPGTVLLCIAFGRVDQQEIGTRNVHATAMRRQPSIRMDDVNIEDKSSPEGNKGLFKGDKTARLKELANTISMIEPTIADAKQLVTQLSKQLSRNLSVTVIEASDLRDTETFGKIDPYVKLTIIDGFRPDGTCEMKKTRVIENGGHERPVWNETLEFQNLLEDYDTLIVDVYDEDQFDDDHLGTVKIPLSGVFEAKETKLWLDLEDNDGGNSYRCGEIRLGFVFTAPDAGIEAQYRTAVAALAAKQEELRMLEREKRMLSDDGNEQHQLKQPKLQPYRLLVHIFQAKNLLAADVSGTADPYIIGSIGGKTQQTSTKHSTLNPHWYETLSYDIDLPDKDHIDSGLAPEIVLQIFDHDALSADDFIARCALSLRGVGPQMPASPEWRPLRVLDSSEFVGELLVSLQLMDMNHDPMNHVPHEIQPKMRRCTIEMMLLGCRGLKSFNYIDPVAPYVSFQLNGQSANTKSLLTKPVQLPSPTDPNYLEIVKISCHLPEDPVFSPTLTARVLDKRFGGLREPLLGSTDIKLNQYLPWIDKNAQLMMKRYHMNAESFSQPSDSANATAARSVRMGRLQGNSEDDSLLPVDVPASESPRTAEPEPEPSMEQTDQGPTSDSEDIPPWRKIRLIDGKTLDNELEDALSNGIVSTVDGFLSMSCSTSERVERLPFDTWSLARHEVSLTDVVSGNIGSLHQGQGAIKGLIRIVDHSQSSTPSPSLNSRRQSNLLGLNSNPPPALRRASSRLPPASVSRMRGDTLNQSATYLPWPIDLGLLLRPTAVVVRVYCVRAMSLKAMDSNRTSDPYIEAMLGTKKQESVTVSDTLEPYFGHCFEFESTLPGPSKLILTMKDKDFLSDAEIGRTEIDLEDRFFGKDWQQLVKKPLERRTLRLPGSKVNRGKLELWVDVLTKSEAARQPVVDISKPPPAEFEMRMIIWRARNMPAMDILTNSNDLFFSCHLATVNSDGRKVKEQMQETDTHWRSGNGKGSFNWRCIFDVELPQHRRSPCRLSIKGWDKDPMTFSSDLIGYTDINLNHALFKEGLRKWNQLQRRDADILAMDATSLRRKIEELGEVALGAEVNPDTGKLDKRMAKIAIPANATEDEMRKILRDFSEGEAGTIVRFPSNKPDDVEGNDGDRAEGDVLTSITKSAKAASKATRKLVRDAMRVGSDNTPRAWVPLHHPNTGDAKRGEVEISIELLPKSLAQRRQAGVGRSAPNAHPVLPEPEGRVELSLLSPLATFKALVGSKLCKRAQTCILAV